ncbi:hypothetical protein FQR65_LT10621 [Abscondita terminalis]|nr:hypothetical protein FQR65_LT10621 [Abscondita terminalis]
MYKLVVGLCLLFFILGCQAQIIPTVCLAIKCPVPCRYGYVKDRSNCSTCLCYDPCCNFPCRFGEQCLPQPVCVLGGSCSYTPRCVPCTEPKCPSSCLYGNKLNERGCKTCECINPCEFHKCLSDEYCVADPVPCRFDIVCGVRYKCVKICPAFECKLYCKYGYELDSNNCPICKCKNPCQNVTCPKFHYCAVREIFCAKEPCPEPKPYCKSYCDDRALLLKDKSPVICDKCDVKSCEPNYVCTTIDELKLSICCEDLYPIAVERLS